MNNMDKYDILEDKMCAILSIISGEPRKMCDKYVTELNQGVISTSTFMYRMANDYGKSSVENIQKIMTMLGGNYE